MPENKTIVSIGFDSNDLPQASIESTEASYEQVVDDAKKIIEYLVDLTSVGKEIEFYDDEEEEDGD